MSYRITAAAVKGNRLELMPDVVRAAGLQGYGAAQEVESWSMVADEIPEAGVSRTAPVAACVVGGWTLIPSGEIALAAFEGNEALASLVQSHAMSLVSVVAESTTGMYGYRLTEPAGTRFVLVEGGRLEESGTALTCEPPIVIGKYTEEDLLEVRDHLGIDFENGLADASPILVWRHA
jgi:hypothetical protein